MTTGAAVVAPVTSPSGDHRGEARRSRLQLLPRRRLRPAVVGLAVLAGLTLVVTMEGAENGGRPAVEVSLVVVPQATAVRTARVGPETDVKTTMTGDDPASLDEGDQGTPEAEEEGVHHHHPPLVKVTTVDEGLVDAPSWPTSWIGW